MKAHEFVEGIRKVVVDGVASGVVSILRCPPGRRPSDELVGLSRWYQGLPESDKVMVARLLALCARDSVLGVFEVLDGAVKIDSCWAPGDYFELRHVRHVRRDEVEVLSGPSGAPLHELL